MALDLERFGDDCESRHGTQVVSACDGGCHPGVRFGLRLVSKNAPRSHDNVNLPVLRHELGNGRVMFIHRVCIKVTDCNRNAGLR